MAALNGNPPHHTASPTSISSEPLLEANNNEDIQERQPEPGQGMSRSQALNLYTSHFLSTWNIRTYEFAAIVFTAAAYPETLVAIAIRGIIRNLSSICLSSTVGRAIDKAPDRFKTLVYTISLNRASVILASSFWCIMLLPQNSDAVITKALQFIAILVLGIVEGLSGQANMLSMERDWVPALRAPDGEAYDLTHLNAIMRRIDLVCKLVAPILISFVISYTGSSIGAIVVGGMSAVSWGLEYFCAKRVWLGNTSLRAPKPVIIRDHAAVPDGQAVIQRMRQGLRKYVQDFRNYFSTKVWIPSMSLSLLHLSALSYGGVFVTFLLSAGFSLEIITIARAVGSIVEISSTVVTPVGVQYLGKAHTHGRFQSEDHNEDDGVGLLEQEPQLQGSSTETGLERLGLWGLSWQLFNLVPVVFALWSLSPGTTSTPPVLSLLSRFLGSNPSQAILALTLFSFLSLSRLGLWIFDLTTQQLTQTLVAPHIRSSFTGVEYSFVSIFELMQLVTAIALPKPEQFWLLALISFGAVATSTIAYATWVRGVRGHLVHWERFGKSQCGGKR